MSFLKLTTRPHSKLQQNTYDSKITDFFLLWTKGKKVEVFKGSLLRVQTLISFYLKFAN